MSVSSVASTQTAAVTQTQPRGNSTGRKAFDAAADALKMTSKDLRAALKGGQSMSDIAAKQGVSTDKVTSAIASALTSADSSISADKAKQIAANFVAGPAQTTTTQSSGTDAVRGKRGGPPPGGPPPEARKAMDSLASTLGMSSNELQAGLQSGKSLTSIAASKGMDATTLKSTLTKALTEEFAKSSTSSTTSSTGTTATSTATGKSSVTKQQVSDLADKIIAGPEKHSTDNSMAMFRQYLKNSSASGATSNGTSASGSTREAAVRAMLSAKYSAQNTTTSSTSSLVGATL